MAWMVGADRGSRHHRERRLGMQLGLFLLKVGAVF